VTRTRTNVCANFARTDLGNAERLVALHGDDLRYAAGLGWFSWDGRRWRRDVDGAAMRRAKATVRSMYAAASELDDEGERKKLTQWAIASESEPRLRAMVKLAETELAVLVEPAQFDADPWLFNAANGTIDLRTRELREHCREDLLTRIAPAVYEPRARHDVWDTFVATLTGGDVTLASFLERAAGYSLTGHTGEDVLFFVHGPSATGKSSYLEAKRAALGDDYVMTADFETFLKRRGDAGIRNDVARLAGARLVISVEVDEGKELAEGLVKMLTGGDTVAARFLYREVFEFTPRFKLWLAANARPAVNPDDAAMWRRILQVPFVHVIPEHERDDRLKLRLRTDPEIHAAILAWAVEGCADWQRQGLAVPDLVRDYTEEYRRENDPVGQWITDACRIDPAAWTSAADLTTAYESWCADSGEIPVAPKQFAAALKNHGCTSSKRHSRRGWSGIHAR
jgi:putative DNA primase/helicase